MFRQYLDTVLLSSGWRLCPWLFWSGSRDLSDMKERGKRNAASHPLPPPLSKPFQNLLHIPIHIPLIHRKGQDILGHFFFQGIFFYIRPEAGDVDFPAYHFPAQVGSLGERFLRPEGISVSAGNIRKSQPVKWSQALIEVMEILASPAADHFVIHCPEKIVGKGRHLFYG